jgi:protein SCO1
MKWRGPLGLALAGLMAAVLLLGTATALWVRGDGGQPSIGGAFTLTSGDRTEVSDRSFSGKYMLVYFGYTFCPDVCPTTLNQVAEALDRLGPKADRVQPIFITLDPRRDTPEVVKQYTAAFSPRLIGLTGSPQQIAQVAKAYRVYYAEHRTGSGPDDYTVDHSSILYLMGPDGKFVAPIRADQTGEQMAAEIAKLVS